MKKDEPLHKYVQDYILTNIETRVFVPGEIIPSERELTQTLGVTRTTVKKAIAKLVDSGYLRTEAGIGTFVKKFDHELFIGNKKGSSQHGMNELVRLTGKVPFNKIIGQDKKLANDFIANKLEQPVETPILSLKRLRFLNEQIYSFEHSFIPISLFPNIEYEKFESRSLFEYMKLRGHNPVSFDRTLRLVQAKEDIAELLEIPLDTLIYQFEFISKNAEGVVVEYNVSYMRMDFIHFRTNY